LDRRSAAFEDGRQDWNLCMKIAGFLLLVAGWIIVLSALMLLTAASPRSAFALAGVGVEVLGIVLVFRSYLMVTGEGR
jgi:hypothetical protein